MKNTDRLFKIFAWAFWPIFFLVNNFIGATSVLMEYSRRGAEINAWEPFIWEFSSGILILALIPVLIWIDHRRPFQKDTWKTTALMHLGLSVPFSLIHVGGMVTIRKIIYSWNGSFYDFGNVPVELVYEYRKDILGYAMVLFFIYAFRHFRFRYAGTSGHLEDKNLGHTTGPISRLVLKTGTKQAYLKLDDIERLEAAGNYVNIHAGDKRIFLRATLGEMEEKLPKDIFARIHRSAIINKKRIKNLIPKPSGDARIIMDSGAVLNLSRRYKDRLKPINA